MNRRLAVLGLTLLPLLACTGTPSTPPAASDAAGPRPTPPPPAPPSSGAASAAPTTSSAPPIKCGPRFPPCPEGTTCSGAVFGECR